jgi:hypothetical protein
MNFIVAFFVIIGSFPKEIHSEKEPQVFFYNGQKLIMLNEIFVPNIRRENFRFFVKSQYELEYASMDSSEVAICLVDRITKQEMQLKGRWYTIRWETGLRVGSERHMIFFTARSGTVFTKRFTINVEGTKRLEKPLGEGK